MKPLAQTYFAGDTWSLHVEVTDPTGAAVDFTGCSAMVEFRPTDVTQPPAATLTQAAGITLGVGTVDLTAQIPVTWSGDYVWDLRITTTGGQVTHYVAGVLTVQVPSTRD